MKASTATPWRPFVTVFVVSTLIALCFRFFVAEDFRIASASMLPTLQVGDLVFVSKNAYSLKVPFTPYELLRVSPPKRGDVVAFSLPEHRGETFVKRIVALAGDRVEIREGKLRVNDEIVVEETLNRVPSGPALRDYGPVDIPQDRFFALGDNREDSTDSRVWGPVPYSFLKGKVSFVWLSFNEKGGLRRDRFGLAIR